MIIEAYIVRIIGPGVDHQAQVACAEDVDVLETILRKMRRHFAEVVRVNIEMCEDVKTTDGRGNEP